MLLKFLIVDDCKAMRTIIKRILFNAGYADHDFHFCENGEDAITEIIDWRPDIVLLDWHMSGITGLQVLEMIRKLKIDTKIGLITAESNKQAIAQAKAAGAMFIVQKPFTLEDLRENLIPALAGMSPIEDEHLIFCKDIIFPLYSTLSLLLTTITNRKIKVEKVERLNIEELALPGKIVLYGDDQSQVKAVQILDVNLSDYLAEAFVQSLYADQPIDDKLLSKGLLKALTIIGACFHDIKKEKELRFLKTYLMPKLIDKVITMDRHPNDERLDLKFSFDDSDVCYSILYLEEQENI